MLIDELAQAVLDARSRLGARRPDDEDDAAQWDALTEAARRLAAQATGKEPLQVEGVEALADDEGPLGCAELFLRMQTLGSTDIDDGSLADGLKDARATLRRLTAAQKPPAERGVSDAMVERALKQHAIDQDGAVWPDDYSESEHVMERGNMRRVLTAALGGQDA